MHAGNVLVGTSKEVVLAWWGPEDHILQDPKVNSIVCQPEDEDTLITTVQCTGWIKLLLSQGSHDVYSGSGKSTASNC